MKFLFRAFIAILLIFPTVNESFAGPKGEKEFATVYFYHPMAMVATYLRIRFPNQDQFNLYPGALVNYKVFSEGEMYVTMETSGNEYMAPKTLQIKLDVKHGKSYYVICKATSMKEVPRSELEKKIAKEKNIVKHEENIDFPINRESIENKSSGKGQGTCFLISPDGYLITNYHCIENSKEISVSGIDGDFSVKYSATVVSSDPSNDLALIKVSNKNLKFDEPPFAVRTSGVVQAERVYALGFPIADAMGNEIKITEGIISSKSGYQGDISKFQISAQVNAGNSGGPLIDENGNVIGVIYAKLQGAEAAGYAVKASYVETFLNNVDGFTYKAPVNKLQDKSFPDKVAALKKYIYIIETN